MQNRQVFGLYRLNEQIFPALECYLKFSLYRMPHYSMFDLDRLYRMPHYSVFDLDRLYRMPHYSVFDLNRFHCILL